LKQFLTADTYPPIEVRSPFLYNKIMLVSKLYSQLYVCPVCKGWGGDKASAKKRIVCKQCGGLGVFLMQQDQSYIWRIPNFIDFRARKLMFISRVAMMILGISFFIVITFLIFGSIQSGITI